jgi:hypothetical protein
VVAAALCLCLSAPRAAEPPPGRPCVAAAEGERFTVDFRDVPLRTLTRLVSCALSRALIFSPATLGDRAVTVIAPRAVSARALEALWLGALNDAGLVLEPRGAYTLIRPDDQAPSKSFSTSGR